MSIQNTFPVFEPDQVLTNNHLNDMLNYLEQQERLTRCKLLGSGIVCGLEITFQEGPDNEDSIEISKGCGLTSQGYIITMCDSIYKRYIPYSRKNFPEHLKLLLQCGQETGESKINFYGEGSDNSVLELITEKVFDELDSDEKKKVKLLNQNKKIKMDSYAVVLFLEAEEFDLKNCDTNDCNDKGSRMEFEVKALLVDKALLREKRGSTNKPVLHHIELKRYNVPVNDLKSADDVLNEFDRLTDDTTIKILSEDLSYCYENYKYLLKDENTNPFTSLNSDLQKHKKFILKDFPVLIQYFYDFVDDLIKAFYEFKHKVYDVMSECCGDEMRFPFHLMLGKATASTNSGVRSEYRQYFIYSPLFDSQNTKLNEIRCLFTRMKLMYEEFLLTEKQFKENRGFLDQVVKITPSRYGHVYLSDRCIPYYFNVTDKGKELYQYWNYNKTRRGNARFNLSYNSNKYSSSAPVVSPLEYDTERFNFFRVEGHIGKSINTAMPEVKKVQQVNNLPFDIIPLSADLFGTLLRGEDPKCIIQDLESDYRVLIAEFICKLHEVFCFYSGLTFRNTVSFIGSIAGNTRSAGPSVNEIEYAKILIESASKKNVNLNQTFASLLVNRFQASKTYRKGDTLSELCDPGAGTIGSAYLKNVKNNIFKNPVGNQNDFQFHIFEFIDRIENMFLILMSNELSELNISGFKKEYEKFEEEAKWLGIVQLLILGVIESKKTKETQLEDFWSDFALDMLVYNSQRILHTCFLERLKALKDEYERRVAQYRLAKNFNYYFKHHGGVEHKAGVPVGGTFILVYHEERRNRLIDVSSVFINKELGTLMLSRFQNLLKPSVSLSEIEFNTKLLQVSILYRDPELYLRFKDVMSKYLDDCKDLPKNKRKIIQDIIDKPPAQPHFKLKDGMVIADFYVPYMCCSDCPPVAYILPPPPKDETKPPTIKIEGKNFCDNDKTEFPISVTPAGGIITGDGVKVRADGSFVFVPFNVSPGAHTITYTANGKSVSVTVQIVTSPNPKFSFETIVQDGQMTVFLKNESTGTDDLTTYNWLLDGTLFSDKKDPDPIKFKVQTLPHTILLRASNGKCPGEFSAEINLVTEDRQISVCKNADEFPLEPNLSTTDTIKVLSNDGIKMKNKSLMILPAATSVNQTNVFHVSYTINGKQVNVTITLIVVSAGFTMKLEHNPSPTAVFPTILTLAAKQTGADKYAWKLTTVTGSGIDFFTRDVEINLSQINIPAGTQLNILLTVSIMDQSGSACGDTKEFVLTRDIFNKHLNKGEFDNLTTS